MLYVIKLLIADRGGRLGRQMLFLYVVLFACGLLLGGPTIRARVVAGLIACGVCTVLAIGLIGSRLALLRLRHGKGLDALTEARTRIDAMSPDEARATVEGEVVAGPPFLSFAATRPPDPALPPAAAEVFARWDRVDFFKKNNPSALFSICRELVGTVPGNPEAVKVGETFPAGSCIAVSRVTGRVTCHEPPIKAGEVERIGRVPELSYASLWHLLAYMTEAGRIGESHHFEALPRIRGLDNRPRWRIAGAKD